MFKFFLKFTGSMINRQKGRTLIVFLGMLICSFFVLNFFYFCTVGSSTKEEIYEDYFHVTLQYKDINNIEELTKVLEGQEGVTQIQLTTWFLGDISSATAINIPEEVGEMGEHEEVILSAYVPQMAYNVDCIDIGRGFTAEEIDKIMVTYAGAQGHYASKEPGSFVELCGRKYEVCGYYNNWGYDFILPASELISICKENGNAQIQLKYWYDNSLDYDDVIDINNRLKEIKVPYKLICDKPDISVSWDIVIRDGKIIFFSMIISVLNFMFVYQFMLKNRLQQYRVLKLLGTTTNKLQSIMFLELLLTYTISFFVAYILLHIYIAYRELIVLSTAEVLLYSYTSMLVIMGLIFIIFTRSFARKSPFASYQEN